MDERHALESSRDHAEGIGEILQIKVTAQLARAHSVIGYALHRLDECALDTCLSTDVVNLPPFLLKQRDERLIRGNVSGSAAAGENDALHKKTSLGDSGGCYANPPGAHQP